MACFILSDILSNHNVSDGMIFRGQSFSVIKKSVVTKKKEIGCYDTLQLQHILRNTLFHVDFELALSVTLV